VELFSTFVRLGSRLSEATSKGDLDRCNFVSHELILTLPPTFAKIVETSRQRG
jgi:hypothetical protein